MGSENETVAYIANEMRIEWAQVYFSEGSRRKDGEYCDNEFAAIEPETVADRIEAAHQRAVAELKRRLKVAEDALEELQDRLVSSVHDGTIDPHEALKIAEDALAVIREEGGAK